MFEINGTAANGRPETLKLDANRKSDAVDQAQRQGLRISAVREIPEDDTASLGSVEQRMLRALETIAKSPMIKRPRWEVSWGIIWAGLIVEAIGIVIAFTLGVMAGGQ